MIELPKNNSVKIVKQALSFETPDRLPVFVGYIWQEFIENWKKQRNIPADEHFEDYFPVDLCTLRPRETFFPSEIGPVGQKDGYVLSKDGWGRTIRTREGTRFSETVDTILKTQADLDKIAFESASMDSRYTDVIEWAKTYRAQGKAVFINTGGPFLRSSFLRGEMEFLMDMVADEPFAIALVEKVGDHLMQIGLEALKRCKSHDFGVWIYDDMCNILSPMFSPAAFEKILLPVYKKIVAAYKAAGARWVMLHCDGNLLPFLDMIIEAEIDGINPVEHAAGLDVVELIEKYHGKLSFIGGVCNTHILPCGNQERIHRHVEAIVDAGKNGGLVIATHSVGPEVPLENYELYRQIVADKGYYRKFNG